MNQRLTTHLSVLSLLVTGLLLASPVFANISGSDNFNSPTVDTTKWQVPDDGYGNGTLTQTNNRLEFGSSSTADSFTQRYWKLNLANYSESFSFQIDTFVPTGTSATNAFTSFGLEMGFAGAVTKFVDLEHGAHNGTSRAFNMFQGDTTNGTVSVGTESLNTFTQASLRLSYNASTHVITGAIDNDGAANGYTFTTFHTFNIAGGSGSDSSANWGMSGNSQFYISVYGYSHLEAEPSGKVYGDNFLAVPEPGTAVLGVLGAVGILGFRQRRCTTRL